jgi:predicted transcriptional regulator
MDTKLIELTSAVVASYLEHNHVPANELPNLIISVHAALAGTEAPAVEASETVKLTSAQIRKSITPDHLVSFLDGKKYRTLKRHLATHRLTFAGYRERFGLPQDYPTVAPAYSAQRSALAKQLGLGSKGRAAAPAAAPAPAPKKTARAKKAAG